MSAQIRELEQLSRVSSPAAEMLQGEPTGHAALSRDLEGIVHVLTCGSVDDGKSTLIGRLLWETHGVPDDQREMVIQAAQAAGTPDRLDFSLLLDGLVAEREQGITIDIAWRYMDTATRRLVVIDCPGHEQYTRNMASGASHADVAVMLVDARHGIKKQTRRHAAILELMGVRRVVLAVNKMDLVDWNEQRFREIERELTALIEPLSFSEAVAIPVSAREGANVAAASSSMPWYAGPTLVAYLESVPSQRLDTHAPFRMPVQCVLRDGQDFRGFAGTISSGVVSVGDVVANAASAAAGHVVRIATMDGDLASAAAGRAVAIQLDTDLDISRGALLCTGDDPPVLAHRIEARLVWLDEAAFDLDHDLILRTATDTVPVVSFEVMSRLDLHTLRFTSDTLCNTNDVVAAAIETARPVAIDRFAGLPETGSFLLVAPLTGRTLAAGVVLSATSQKRAGKLAPFALTRTLLARGICADLGTSDLADIEFQRRAREVATILEQAGVRVEVEGSLIGGTP